MNNSPLIVLDSNLILIKNLIPSIQNPADNLYNKHLYLGQSGAINWIEINDSYRVSSEENSLLENHYLQIHKIVLNAAKELDLDSYDIVSLGSGTGDDDKTILKIIGKEKKDCKKFSIIAVDISIYLLETALVEIHDHLKKRKLGEVKLKGLCCDFDNFNKNAAGSYISEFRTNKHGIALYHLLGLTLGNNEEEKLLNNISTIMREGDFLLIAVDFSANSSKFLDESIKAYEDNRLLIDKFLSGPMLLAAQIQKNRKTSLNCICLNSQINNFSIVYIKEESNQFSDVKNTVNFTRRHHFKDGRERICDYSNKYKVSDFNMFINGLKTKGIPLELYKEGAKIDEFACEAELFLGLVLLKKNSIERPKPTPEKPISHTLEAEDPLS